MSDSLPTFPPDVEARLLLSAIVEGSQDAIISKTLDGIITSWNAGAKQLYGYTAAEMIGRPISVLIPPSQPDELPAILQRLRRGEHIDHYETVRVRKDGRRIDVSLRISPITNPTGRIVGASAIAREITPQKQAERRRSARLAVTQILAEAQSVQAAVPAVLRAVCEGLQWDVGAVWTVDAGDDAVRCLDVWHQPAVHIPQFVAACRTLAFPRDLSLPGRVWNSGQPLWIPNVVADGNFVRADVAAREGLHGALACPIRLGEQTLGVIEFFSREIREPDADLLEMIVTLGGQIGQFMERKRAEEQVRRSEHELADFFQNATVGLHWVGSDGTVLRVNQAELDLLGYAEEEYVGRHIAEFHADQEVISDILRRLAAGEELHDFPARMKCKDGLLKDVLIDSSVRWEDGRFVHTRCFTRDVTDRKRAEHAAQQRQRQLELIANNAPVLIAHCDTEHRYTFVNRPYAARFGLEPQDLIGRRVPDVLGEEAYAVIAPYMEQALAGQRVEFEAEVPYRDLPTQHMLCAYEPELDADGRAVGYVAAITNVTAQKQAERALRDSEQRFARFMQHVPGLAWIKDPAGRYVYANEAALSAFGVTPERIIGRTDCEVFPPETAAQFKEHDRRARANAAGVQFVETLRHSDGTLHHSLVSKFPIPAADGKDALVGGMAIDITERKRFEEDLQFLADASAALAAIVDYESTLQKVASLAVPHFADWCAVDLAEPDGTLRRLAVAHADPAKVAFAHELQQRYPPDPDSPHGAYHVLRTGQPELMTDIPNELLARAARDEEHLRIIRELGLKSFVCVPLVARGRTIGVITFVTAESGRRFTASDQALAEELARRAAIALENTQLYRELKDADRRKDEFLATLAHELRNPLAPIRNSLQILKMPRLDDETVHRTREMMERQVHHLVRLVDDLLDVSRVMRGKIELRTERVELASVVARAVETAQPLIDAQGHELIVELPTESMVVEADPVRLAQVVGNLLTNAAKYTEAGGRIELSIERDAGQAVLRVRDSGIGIPPEMLPQIFELFVQVDSTATRSQGGLGIGLTLVKNLVEMHHGSVEAHSDGPGQGSEFVVRLPLAAPQPDDPSHGPRAAQPQPVPTGLRLLVVDDNADAAGSLALLLGLQGHDVRVAHDGPSALEMLNGYVPDVVFLDIGMPGMDGYEVARRLRQSVHRPTLRLVALTGWGQQEDRRRSAEAGFDHHLVKPVDPGVLEELLKRLD